jgi:hypothetical protein
LRKDQEVPERISGQGRFIQGFLDEKMKYHAILNHFRQTRSSDGLAGMWRAAGGTQSRWGKNSSIGGIGTFRYIPVPDRIPFQADIKEASR